MRGYVTMNANLIPSMVTRLAKFPLNHMIKNSTSVLASSSRRSISTDKPLKSTTTTTTESDITSSAQQQQPPSATTSASSLTNKVKVTEQSYFDTHVFVNALVNSGYTNKQAEQICYLFKDITNSMAQDIKRECVTKSSQELAIQQIMIHIGSLKKDMIILEKSEFSQLRNENEKLEMQLKSLKELINDEIIKLKGGFNLDMNLEKNKTTEMKYDLDNRIARLNSRIDVEISAFRTILESFKSESVKYVAGSVLTALVVMLGVLRFVK